MTAKKFDPQDANAAIIGCGPLATRLENNPTKHDLKDAAKRLRLFSEEHIRASSLVEIVLEAADMYRNEATCNDK